MRASTAMTPPPIDVADRIHACLIAGAIGDALGAAVEFDTLSSIRARFGPAGLTDFAEAYGRLGAITDDTQMTLFTAEGLIRAHVRQVERGISDPVSVLHHAYLRWLLTQGLRPSAAVAVDPSWPDGWLIGDQRLFSTRAPGATCLSALRAANALGEPARNDSKGCGTVMRVAPIGLLLGADAAFDVGVESSALTHGHPTGFLAGGAFALILHHLLVGASLADAVEATRAVVVTRPHADETVRAIDAAVARARSDVPPSPAVVESLGGGWIAEEALAIALYCAWVARSFEEGVLLAVNHSGDSDSTASMAGQILGLQLGLEAIPLRWRSHVEFADVVAILASDLAAVRAGSFTPHDNATRYPAW